MLLQPKEENSNTHVIVLMLKSLQEGKSGDKYTDYLITLIIEGIEVLHTSIGSRIEWYCWNVANVVTNLRNPRTAKINILEYNVFHEDIRGGGVQFIDGGQLENL